MPLDPIAKDLLAGLTKRYYKDQWPLARALMDCAVSGLKVYGEPKLAAELQEAMKRIAKRVPK
jgi:hypothetical protein